MVTETQPANHTMWSSFGISDVGKIRQRNEDSMLVNQATGLWIVADGMGGHTAGDMASQMIIKSLNEIDLGAPLDRLIDSIEDELLGINQHLFEKSHETEKRKTIGSTIVGMLVHDEFCTFFWAGDSRLYRSRDSALQQLTTDHSQVESYIKQGLISRREAASHPHGNMVLRAVGAAEKLYVEFDIQTMQPRDRYMLCSDGLTKHLEDLDIQEIMAKGNTEESCKELIDVTLERGAGDNVTVIVVDIH